MAYNPYDYVKQVYDAKVAYGNATTEEEKLRQQQIANDARKKLNAYGYGDLAKQVGADNATAEAVKRLLDSTKTDKVKTRDYLYDLGKSHGMSKLDMDNIIGWDDDTGQVSLGGKVIGAPDAVIDGVSYWGDTSKLDSAFNDYITRTGTTRSKETAVNQENESLFKLLKQEYDDLKSTDPFSTKEAKTILSKYDLAGLQGRNNVLASNAGSNGGNIDSFAAANALRQQAALVNEGEMAVLSAHQQKLDHARNLLADMGVNIDRVFNQDETSKNNTASREIAINEATGYNTDNQLKTLSSMWNSDGSLADVNTDYQERINTVKAMYDKATNESDKQSYALALKLLEMARNDKIDATGRKEGKTYLYQNLVDNATTRLNNAQIAQAERVLYADKESAEANIKGQLDLAKIDANAGITQANIAANADITKANIAAETAKYSDDEGEETSVIYAPPDFENMIAQIDTSETGKTHDTYDGVDLYGARLLERIFGSDGSNVVSLDDFLAQAVELSDEYNVNLKQLKKVCAYMGFTPHEIKVLVTDRIEDKAAKFKNDQNKKYDWKDGVVWKD